MNLKIFFIIIFNLIICNLLFAQNITNTLGVSGLFSIKDGSSTYLSLGQSTGYLSLNRSLTLQNTTGSNIGVIFKGADRFIHNYGSFNTFLGIGTGNFTLIGTENTAVGSSALTNLTTGSNNSAFGSASLVFISTGSRNTAVGNNSCPFNKTGSDNVAIGSESMLGNLFLTDNITYSTAIGSKSMYSIISGGFNTAVGYQSLYSTTTGTQNTSIGSTSLYSNTTGYFNTAVGYQSLLLNQTGSYNTALGVGSLSGCTTGGFNTALGPSAGYNITSGFENIVIGSFAQVPSSTSSNQVRIGNTDITYAGIQVAWTITSDRKWKENIITSPIGLKFISRLNPVSYFRINDESKKTEYGLIAQDVEQVLKDEGVSNSAMITVTDEGNYELRYNDLLAPMIKAIQELNEENLKLKTRLETLEQTISTLKSETTVNASNER